MFSGIVLSRDEAQVFLNAPCSLERCDFRVEVGLKEKWDAGIDQSIEGVRMKTAMNPLTIR